MSLGIQILISFFLLCGMVFCFGGSLGLIRFPDVYCRLHALGKPITLGVISFLLAAMIYFLATGQGFNAHTLIAIIFILLTTPVATHMIIKASYHRKVPLWPGTLQDDLARDVAKMHKNAEKKVSREHRLRQQPQ